MLNQALNQARPVWSTRPQWPSPRRWKRPLCLFFALVDMQVIGVLEAWVSSGRRWLRQHQP